MRASKQQKRMWIIKKLYYRYIIHIPYIDIGTVIPNVYYSRNYKHRGRSIIDSGNTLLMCGTNVVATWWPCQLCSPSNFLLIVCEAYKKVKLLQVKSALYFQVATTHTHTHQVPVCVCVWVCVWHVKLLLDTQFHISNHESRKLYTFFCLIIIMILYALHFVSCCHFSSSSFFSSSFFFLLPPLFSRILLLCFWPFCCFLTLLFAVFCAFYCCKVLCAVFNVAYFVCVPLYVCVCTSVCVCVLERAFCNTCNRNAGTQSLLPFLQLFMPLCRVLTLWHTHTHPSVHKCVCVCECACY